MTTDIHTHAHSSQAGLASFAGYMPPAPVTIYAAVIEWPSYFTDAEPSLILARSERERDAAIYLEIQETGDILSDSEWRDAIASTNSSDWRDWLDALDATSYGQPFVTTYEREV